MKRSPFDRRSVQAAKRLRAGVSRLIVCKEFGIDLQRLARIETAYGNVPDDVLAHIERLLIDQDRLRSVISTLLQQA